MMARSGMATLRTLSCSCATIVASRSSNRALAQAADASPASAATARRLSCQSGQAILARARQTAVSRSTFARRQFGTQRDRCEFGRDGARRTSSHGAWASSRWSSSVFDSPAPIIRSPRGSIYSRKSRYWASSSPCTSATPRQRAGFWTWFEQLAAHISHLGQWFAGRRWPLWRGPSSTR